MIIEEIEAYPIDIPRRPTTVIRSSYNPVQSARYVIVRIRTDAGLEGYGEASPELEWTGEDLHSCHSCIVHHLAPALKGHDPLHVQQAVDLMHSAIVQNPHAKGAVEMALWDLVGKRADLPLAELWGGRVRERVAVKFVVSGPPQRASDMAAEVLEKGFRYIKIKVGKDPQADIDRVRAVRETVGPEVPVGVDANMGWTPIQAVSVLPALEELGVAFIEQPFSRWPRERLRDFSQRTPIPVVAHESCFTVEDARDLLATRAVDIWAITPGTHGGYLPTRDILALAHAGGIPCLLGSTLELGIGSAFMAHIGLAAKPIDGTVASDIIGSFYHEVDVIAEKLLFEEGGIAPPPGPGLGVTLNREALTDFRAPV